MIHYDRCPVCDSGSISLVLTARDHTVSGEKFDICQCANCSLRFTQDVPEQESIGKYYRSDNYISHTETNKGIVNAAYLQVRKFTLGMKKKLIARTTGLSRGSLLDVGAGTGAFVNFMQSAGWRVEGVEPDEQAIKKAAAAYGVQLKPSRELFNFGENSFDAITLWHVLEHVHDLHGYMKQLKRICKPAGKIIIAVPNYTSADAEHYGSFWAAYDVPRHLYHFSPAAIHALADIHQCKVEAIVPMWFDSFYVSLLSEKYQGGGAVALWKGFWQGLASNRKASANRRKASSLIYILHPRKS